jgi:hypothetical protein
MKRRTQRSKFSSKILYGGSTFLRSNASVSLAFLSTVNPRARVEAEDESKSYVASDAPPASSMKGDLFRARATLRQKFVLSVKVIS